MICRSQASAAEKYTSLLAQNSTIPEAQIAPAPHEINWNNIALSYNNKQFRKICSVLLLIAMLIAYVLGLNEITAVFTAYLTAQQETIFNGVCP